MKKSISIAAVGILFVSALLFAAEKGDANSSKHSIQNRYEECRMFLSQFTPAQKNSEEYLVSVCAHHALGMQPQERPAIYFLDILVGTEY